MNRLLILANEPDEYRKLVVDASLPDLTVVASADVIDGILRGRDCNILLADPHRAREAIPQLDQLEWTQVTWAGVEPLMAPGLRRDYTLTNVRGIFGPLMSEFVFGYLLAHERRVVERFEAQQRVHWDPTAPGTLRNKTIGIVGVGTIGCHLAGTARHFGMHVCGYTRSSEGCTSVERYYHGSDKAPFARGLDYLVAVLPGTEQTRAIVDAEMLDALPPHAVVVNVGRGSTIDEDALVDALRTGRVGGAVLDVFAEEPLPPSHPFWSTPSTRITCHTAAPSFPADIAALFIENYRRFVTGEPLAYRVDFERGY